MKEKDRRLISIKLKSTLHNSCSTNSSMHVQKKNKSDICPNCIPRLIEPNIYNWTPYYINKQEKNTNRELIHVSISYSVLHALMKI